MLNKKAYAEFIDAVEARICAECDNPETNNMNRYYGLMGLRILRQMNEVLKTIPEEETETRADCPPWTESTFPETPTVEAPAVATPSKTITLEEVRAALAAARIEGKVDVPALVRSFGAKKLGEIPAERYEELLNDLETLKKEAG